jgi:hypothetical protein
MTLSIDFWELLGYLKQKNQSWNSSERQKNSNLNKDSENS